MSDPLELAIQKALLRQLDTPGISSPVTPIAYPFVAYTPTPGTAYIDARAILRAAPETPALAFTGRVLRRGIFQVDAVVPDGGGEGPGLRLAALVVARFPPNTQLVVGGYRLLLLNEPHIAAAVKDAPWVRFPVSIPYLLIN